MKRFSKLVMACALAAALVGLVSNQAAADDFRIETKVFVGKETEPASEDLTLFRGEQVYDFLNKPREVTVFDKPRSRVILLDPARRVKTEVTMERLMAFSDELRTWCGKQSDPLLKFAAEPSFDQSLDSASNELVFASPFLTYRIATVKAGTDDIARQYLEFSDSYARLNAMTNPGSTPPFPRLKIDEALFISHAVPERVQLTMPLAFAIRRQTDDRAERASRELAAAGIRSAEDPGSRSVLGHVHAAHARTVSGIARGGRCEALSHRAQIRNSAKPRDGQRLIPRLKQRRWPSLGSTAGGTPRFTLLL